jgi:CHAD domain-containing protein
MALELKDGEEIGAGLRRTIKQLVEESIALMRRARSANTVHETRKDIKKLRAILRLMRGVLDDEFAPENRSLRDTGRRLTDVRDAEVIVQTIAALGKLCVADGPRRAFRRSRARLLPQSRGKGRSLPKSSAQKTAGELERFLGRAGEWPFDTIRWGDLAGGLEKVYKDGRRTARVAALDPSVPNLHEWRKRVKDLWYAVRLLKPAWPEVMAALGAELKRLSDLLGDDHDLAILRERLAMTDGSEPAAEDFSVLRDVLDKHRDDLQRSAIAIGRRLYSESPRAFVRRIGGYLQTDGA